MKKESLLCAAIMLTAQWAFAQQKSYWTTASEPPSNQIIQPRTAINQYQLFTLDLSAINSNLVQAPSRESARGRSSVVMEFPTPDGKLESFRIVEASVLHPELAARYAGIRSFAGQGIDDPTATIRFSVSDQEGFHGMILSGKRSTYYIDPHTTSHDTYRVYARENLASRSDNFQCMTSEASRAEAKSFGAANGRTNDKKLRKYRLALSCTAEYGNIFAGSTGTDAQKKANILAQMNVTMTRVNGVYEHDLAITLEIIPNNDLVIYYGSTTADPWSNEWNTKTQQVIDAAIGNANYDIGHNFNTTGGGNAGCIGCVCTTGSKGSGYTGRSDPTGDAFDIDYVAHEMGHQFGGYHTQSNSSCRSGSGATEVEPGSGSTIMGYAGICAANVQNNSDAYFAYVNIRDISANIQTGVSSACAQVINIANNPPTANAGPDYTIPKSTAFALRGQGSDPDGDALTYTWEQNDPGNPSSNASPTATRTAGPMFRSRQGTSSPDRFLPQVSDVVANNLAPTWEVIPSVGRTLNFSLTVRDNKAGGGQTSDDLMVVTVNGTAGPFVVSAPNTTVTWTVGSSQTVTWDVAGTSAAPVNCANVNILLSTDGGFTYPVTLVSNTPNDGSQAITVPNSVSSSCRVKVEAAGNIFYDISNTNFTITGAVSCTATTPTGLAASSIASAGATLGWNAVSGATYEVQYRVVGTTAWTTVTAGTNSLVLTGLTANTQYEAQVRSLCPSSSSAFSSSVNFTTLTAQLAYCASKGNSVADEYIGRVQLGTINNVSGANAGYGNFTVQSTNLAKSTAYTMTITPTWTGTVYSEGYSVWIDYNADGDFTDTGEQVFSRAATTTTPVSGSFTVPGTAATGATRMRVSMKYNAIPTSCETFSYGEVEDYTVNIQAAAADTQAPTAPTNLTASAITQTSATLTWTASTDNVGVTGYEVRVNGTLSGTVATTSYALAGLAAATTFSVSVTAKDAAGNASTAATINVTTLSTTVTYCASKGNNVSDEYIGRVQLGTINNASGANAGYGNFTSLSTNLARGTAYTITITPTWTGTVYSEGYSVWIDYNLDGDFTDTGEQVLSRAATTTTPVSGSFTIPATAAAGATRIRVSMKYNGIPTSCETFTYGEVEDYTVNIQATARPGDEVVNFDADVELYPNPVTDRLKVILPAGIEVRAMQIILPSGAAVKSATPQTEIDVSDLNQGLYILTIDTNKGMRRKKFLKQ